MIYDNPAAALHSILERGSQEKHDQSCHVVWRKLLNVTQDDHGGLISKLGSAMELPRKILILIQSTFPNQLNSANIWLGAIESAFLQQQLSGNWGTFAAHIQPYCLAQLSLTSELFQTRLSTRLVAEEDLAKVQASLSELIAAIDASSLDARLKAYLCRELAEIQQAIRDYRVSGALPILQRTEAMLGHSLLDPSYSSFLTSHELGARLLENLSAMANLLTVAVSLPQLTQSLGSLLLR